MALGGVVWLLGILCHSLPGGARRAKAVRLESMLRRHLHARARLQSVSDDILCTSDAHRRIDNTDNLSALPFDAQSLLL